MVNTFAVDGVVYIKNMFGSPDEGERFRTQRLKVNKTGSEFGFAK